jgi:hypothetical protein
MGAEALRLPLAGVIFWTEAASDGSGGSRGLAGPPPALKVTVTIDDPVKPPQGVYARVTPRGCALMTPPMLLPSTAPHDLDAAWNAIEQAGVPPFQPVTVHGAVESLDGRYFPRAFSRLSDASKPIYVPLHPSRLATRVTEAGAVVLSLRWDTGAPASWSLATLSCVRAGLPPLAFSAQADVNGDVVVPLTGLPPLAAKQPPDHMTLKIAAALSQARAPIGDPDAAQAVSFSVAGVAAGPSQTFPVPRGVVSNDASLKLSPIVLKSH